MLRQCLLDQCCCYGLDLLPLLLSLLLLWLLAACRELQGVQRLGDRAKQQHH